MALCQIGSVSRSALDQVIELAMTIPTHIVAPESSRPLRFRGKRAAMISFSSFPSDPRPRRALEALLREGMSVDMICLADSGLPQSEKQDGLEIRRLPITHRRGGVLSYFTQYSRFILQSAVILAARTLRRPYDLVWIHNMPDVLVASALLPKLRGAKMILDMHDPMPELMTTIYGFGSASIPTRILRFLERWSMARADVVVTVNTACKRIFSSRSCSAEKVRIVMNTPDDAIFPLRHPEARKADPKARERFVIMYHGSIVERNGLGLAIEALAKVRHRVPEVEFRIYGRSNAYLEQILEKVRQEGLEEFVSYRGSRRLEDLIEEISQCDVGVIPNERNAFTEINTPTRLFEYLSQGKPAIAPRTPGITDYFGDDSLYYFTSGDAASLAQAMERAYREPDEALSVARRGQDVYCAHHWSEERENLLTMVDELLATASRGPAPVGSLVQNG